MESSVGKTSKICIEMALHDFYQTHNHTTKIVPYFRDSKYDRVEAASAAIQLLKDAKVIAIIGPHKWSQANIVVDIGNKAKVPILSMATTPSLSPNQNPYFIRVSHISSSQAQPIAALIKSLSWREVVLVYQDDDFGRGFIPYMSEALQNVGARIKHQSVVSHFASDDEIYDELNKLKRMETRVFVLHLLPELASRFYKKAKEVGMMQKGYAWIITSFLNSLDPSDIDSIQGVLAVKPYIQRSIQLNNFEKRFLRNNRVKLDTFGLWSYDTTYALAMALERVGSGSTFKRQNNQQVITDLDAIGTSKLGSRLLLEIGKTRLKGLSGDFFFVDGELKTSDYEIVNIIGQEEKSVGLWTRSNGMISLSNQGGGIVWPGGSNHIPRGWEIPAMKPDKLRVGFPGKAGFDEFIKTGRLDPKTKETKPTGFCVEVFEAVMEALPQPPPYKYIPFGIVGGKESGSYNDLVYQIVLEKFDVVIGDVPIRANRTKYVEFTLPYTESGIIMIVPIKVDKKNAWIFMRPLEAKLWLTTCAFFLYTGVVVWVLEHRVNKEFRGRPYKQVGIMFSFSFSTLVFAHKEKLINNLSRLVVVVWIFVVLILQSSYIASLISMLTVEQLEPDFTDIYDLMRHGDSVGYKDGSYVALMLKSMGFENSKLKNYSTLHEYDDALSRGTENGGVSAIFDELPYVQLFLATYCNKYIMVGPTYKTAGFGFAFPKGSPLVPLVLKAMLQVMENKLLNISDKWLGQEANCKDPGVVVVTKSGRLSLDSFTGLFLIAGLSSTSALIIYLFRFLYENRGILLSDEASILQKLFIIAKTFDRELKKTSDPVEGPAATNDDDNLSVIQDNNPPTTQNHQSGVLLDDKAEPTPSS